MIPETRIPIQYRCKGYFLMWKYNGWHYWQFFSGDMKYQTDGEDYRTRAIRVVALSSGVVTKAQVSAIRTIMHTREVYLWTDFGWAAVRVESGDAVVDRNDINAYEVQFRILIGSRAVSYTGFSPVNIPPVILPTQEYCETMLIGNQVWMCRNYDAAIPGSRVYNDDEANAAIYGRLYSLSQIRTSGFAPVGWRVPTLADWDELITFLGGLTPAGGMLKEVDTTHWTYPNNDATDDYEWTGLPGGYYSAGTYDGVGTDGIFWAADSPVEAGSWMRLVHNSGMAEMQNGFITGNFFSVRLLKILGEIPSPVYGALYNYFVVEDARHVCPEGWHPMTADEMQKIYDAQPDNGAGKQSQNLKETGSDHWSAPNTYSTNSTGFNARGSGRRNNNGETAPFMYIMEMFEIWGVGTGNLQVLAMDTSTNDLLNSTYFDTDNNKRVGVGLRPVKDSTTLSEGETGTYTQNDGTVLETVCVAGLEVVSQNIIETRYRNGDLIPNVIDDSEWVNLTTGAMCYYNNDPAYGYEMVPDFTEGGATSGIWTADDETHTIDNSNLVGGDAQ